MGAWEKWCGARESCLSISVSFFLYLSISVSVCPSIIFIFYMSIKLAIIHFIYAYFGICLSFFLYLSIYLPVCINLCMHGSVYLYLYIYLSLFIYLTVGWERLGTRKESAPPLPPSRRSRNQCVPCHYTRAPSTIDLIKFSFIILFNPTVFYSSWLRGWKFDGHILFVRWRKGDGGSGDYGWVGGWASGWMNEW